MNAKEENLLLIAEKLFAEKGFKGTSTRAISSAAGVNISMISYYFGSKEKLFERIFEYRMNQGLDFSGIVSERTDINAWEKLVLIIERYIYRVKTLKNFYLILQREQINCKNPATILFIKKSKREFVEMYQKLVDEGRKAGIFREDIDTAFLHSTISGTLYNAMNTLSLYKEIFVEKMNYEEDYYERLQKYLIKLMKYTLGYEQNV